MEHVQLTRRGALAGAAVGAGATILTGSSAAAAAAARKGAADLVVLNGNVLVMNARFTRAEAVAIRNGRIQAVGSIKEVRRLIGRRTNVIDARGGTVLPGINDSHVHLNSLGLSLPPITYNVDTATLDELAEVVRTAAAAAPSPDSWVRGRGWNENRLPRAPERTELDPVSDGHPVVLTDFSGHAISVNTIALQIAGIDRNTPAPTGGVIEKDANGEPTGVLRETAMDLVRAHIPAFTEAEQSASIDAGIAQLHAFGITSITEPGISNQVLGLYAAKARNGQLPLRINALLRGGRSVEDLEAVLDAYEPLTGVNPKRLRLAGVKIFADGVPTAAQTAYLHEPYVDGRNGSMVTAGATPAEQIETLHRMIALAHDRRLQVGTHATGDATIDAVVSGYLAAMRTAPGFRDARHYVIHGDLTPQATLRTMAKHDIGVNMNATIKYLLGRTLDSTLGEERTNYQWPYRSALRAGVKVSSSSDAPVTGPNWLQGVMAARLREGKFGGVAGVEERISVREALTTYTRTPAWQDHAGSWKGTLQEGKVADICIVDGDVMGVHPRELVDLSVTHTIVGGEVVYSAGSRAAKKQLAAAAATSYSHETSVDCLQAGMCCCRLADSING